MTKTFVGSSLLAGAVALALFSGSFAQAENVNVNANVNGQLSLAVDTNTVSLTGDPDSTATATGALTTTVRTNNKSGWSLAVRAANAEFSSVDTADVIPVGNLETGAVSVSTSDQVIASSATKTTGTGTANAWDFSLDIPWVDNAAYTNTLVYTATANP